MNKLLNLDINGQHHPKADLQALRQQLKESFPQAHREEKSHSLVQSRSLRLPAFPAGALSEFTPLQPSSGLSLILSELLQGGVPASHGSLPTEDEPLALIDGRDSFDPASYGPDSCARLLWVRCHDADEVLRCCDLLLHDGNLPILVCDLLLNPIEEVRRIPASSWYRLRNLARQSGVSLLVFTPRHVVPCAALQLTFDSTFTLLDLGRNREDLNLIPFQEKAIPRSS